MVVTVCLALLPYSRILGVIHVSKKRDKMHNKLKMDTTDFCLQMVYRYRNNIIVNSFRHDNRVVKTHSGSTVFPLLNIMNG